MIGAALMAVRDVFSPPFRAVLWKSIALTILLFVCLLFGSQFALSYLEFARYPWLEPVIAVAAGAGLFLAFIVLAAPVTALFAGFFLDHIASLVERTHYSADPPGKPLPASQALFTSLRFALTALLVNLLALPFLLFGVGIIAMLLANAYLLSREYFEMSGHRHLSPDRVAELRRAHARRLFLAGLLPAALMLIPFANLFVPPFATAYFIHIFKSITRG
ncbi:MAG: EI24 domain-containing protein [Aestuariivirgaceae bacterium]